MIQELHNKLTDEYAKDFTDNPSESKAQMFEEAGFSPDYNNQGEKQVREYDIIHNEDTLKDYL